MRAFTATSFGDIKECYIEVMLLFLDGFSNTGNILLITGICWSFHGSHSSDCWPSMIHINSLYMASWWMTLFHRLSWSYLKFYVLPRHTENCSLLWHSFIVSSENNICWSEQTLVLLMLSLCWLSLRIITNLCSYLPYLSMSTYTYRLTKYFVIWWLITPCTLRYDAQIPEYPG